MCVFKIVCKLITMYFVCFFKKKSYLDINVHEFYFLKRLTFSSKLLHEDEFNP